MIICTLPPLLRVCRYGIIWWCAQHSFSIAHCHRNLQKNQVYQHAEHGPRAILPEIRPEQLWPIPLVAEGEVGRTSHHP